MHVDIAGAGIIGLSIAWRLAQAGFHVTVREAGEVGRQASWAGAGMLAPGGEFDSGNPWAGLALESLAEYPGFAAELKAATSFPIDFRIAGAVELAYSDEEKAGLERPRHHAVPSKSLSASEASALAPVESGAVRAARWFPNEAIVNPRHVCAALLAACQSLGVEVVERCQVSVLDESRPTVIAAGAWATQVAGLGPVPRASAVKGHLLGYHCPVGSLLPIVRHGHHYALQRENGFTIFGSDEQPEVWSTSPEEDRVQALAKAAAELLPGLLRRGPDDVWAGLRPGSASGSPVVEKLPGRFVWLAYGHFRNGILLAPVTARLVTASIAATLGRD